MSGVLSYELLSISCSCILACVNKNNVLMNLNCHQSNEKCFFPAAGLCGIVFAILQSLFSERNQLRDRIISPLHCEGMCWKILLSVSSPVTKKIRLGTAPERLHSSEFRLKILLRIVEETVYSFSMTALETTDHCKDIDFRSHTPTYFLNG